MAQTSLVPRTDTFVNSGTMVDPCVSRSAESGSFAVPSTSQIPADSKEIERVSLSALGFSNKVVSTLLASHKPSTRADYKSAWRVFRGWCRKRGVCSTSPSIGDVLNFLQDGLDKGLFTSTLKRQVAALQSTSGAVLSVF